MWTKGRGKGKAQHVDQGKGQRNGATCGPREGAKEWRNMWTKGRHAPCAARHRRGDGIAVMVRRIVLFMGTGPLGRGKVQVMG